MKTKTKNFEIKLEALDPTGIATKSESLSMLIVDDQESMANNYRLVVHIGECLYRVDKRGFIIEIIIPVDENMNVKILAQNIVNNPGDFTAEQIEKYFENYAKLRLSDYMAKNCNTPLDINILPIGTRVVYKGKKNDNNKQHRNV